MKNQFSITKFILILIFISSGFKSIATITSVNITQATTSTVAQGSTNQELIRIEVNSSTAETIGRRYAETKRALAASNA